MLIKMGIELQIKIKYTIKLNKKRKNKELFTQMKMEINLANRNLKMKKIKSLKMKILNQKLIKQSKPNKKRRKTKLNIMINSEMNHSL